MFVRFSGAARGAGVPARLYVTLLPRAVGALT